MLIACTLESPFGPLLAATTERGVCLLEMGSPARRSREVAEMEAHTGCALREGEHEHLDHLSAELAAYFRGEPTEFGVPLDTPGTEWQQRVWAKLREIPLGETWSYGRLAETLGRAGSARAVGMANGRNRVSIVIPCHRVIGASGALVGYGGGLDRKRALLEHESGMTTNLWTLGRSGVLGSSRHE